MMFTLTIPRLTAIVAPILLLLGTAAPASAELTPDQIAIIANENSPDSLAVANHYATRRGVPKTHIIRLDLSTKERISRAAYESTLRIPTTQILEKRGLADKIRVLVTTYGVPLRVNVSQPTEQEQRWTQHALTLETQAVTHLQSLDRQLKLLVPASREHKPAPETSAGLMAYVSQEIQKTASTLKGMPEDPMTTTSLQELFRISVEFGGVATFAERSHLLASADMHSAPQNLQQLQQRITAAQTVINALTRMPSEDNRTRAYTIAQKVFGLVGVLRLAMHEQNQFTFKDSDASVDSEMSLLWWDKNSYPVAGRIPSPLYAAGGKPKLNPLTLPILMVSRLDAPSPQLAMRLVDHAISAERHGLKGNIYVDARGRHPKGTNTYAIYDQNLREMAELFTQVTPYRVVLENTKKRFSKPGDAPNVATYVGWYKLRSYEDAFTFEPGAIGYHIASGEAISIHNQKEKGWCKNALDHGITVTLGSTGEPYLDAFPLPKAFLGLLLTGKYSVVEAYYLTSRHISWRMVLFGDPLYNPWRGKGFDGKQVFNHMPGQEPGTQNLPIAPSVMTFNNPIHTRQKINRQRIVELAQIDHFMTQLQERSFFE